MNPIKAELVGSDTCTAEGVTGTGDAPVLALCRLLIHEGLDPQLKLEAYRGNTLCLRVRSIGEAAGLEMGRAPSGQPIFKKRSGKAKALDERNAGKW